jgi:glutamate mutase epsilon subunit
MLLKAAAVRAGFSAFQGHKLCTAHPYINMAIMSIRHSVQDWGFHPNLAGQRALAVIVEGYL